MTRGSLDQLGVSSEEVKEGRPPPLVGQEAEVSA